jgi:hypothetical protein
MKASEGTKVTIAEACFHTSIAPISGGDTNQFGWPADVSVEVYASAFSKIAAGQLSGVFCFTKPEDVENVKK